MPPEDSLSLLQEGMIHALDSRHEQNSFATFVLLTSHEGRNLYCGSCAFGRMSRPPTPACADYGSIGRMTGNKEGRSWCVVAWCCLQSILRLMSMIR